jgi:glycerol transport system ATP-binding protein
VSVRLEGVTKTVRGEAHLRDVSLTFERGTLDVVLGPTPSGEPSLLRARPASPPKKS